MEKTAEVSASPHDKTWVRFLARDSKALPACSPAARTRPSFQPSSPFFPSNPTRGTAAMQTASVMAAQAVCSSGALAGRATKVGSLAHHSTPPGSHAHAAMSPLTPTTAPPFVQASTTQFAPSRTTQRRRHSRCGPRVGCFP